MTTIRTHPAVSVCDSLLALKDFNAANPGDTGAMFAAFCAQHFQQSHSQLFQDLLVLFALQGKRNGFFVEFGATNGIDLSNSYTLEKDFEWRGILAEPATVWHSALKANRKAAIDTRCVWSASGAILEFKETELPELSTIVSFADRDSNRDHRTKGNTYQVGTVSLNDLLSHHGAPKQIDYLSIDTEGSEREILQAFDFANYNISIITVEHNFRDSDRQQIYELLTKRNFMRIFDPLSKYDDWYVNRSILQS